MFGQKRPWVPPHPRQEPRIGGPLTVEHMRQVFEGCVDFGTRQVCLCDDLERRVTLCYIVGMVRNERMCDYVLRPLAQDPVLREGDLQTAYERMRSGALYNMVVQERTDMDSAVSDLIGGS